MNKDKLITNTAKGQKVLQEIQQLELNQKDIPHDMLSPHTMEYYKLYVKKAQLKLSTSQPSPTCQPRISPNELQALYYVGGAVLSSIMKRKWNADISELLVTWAVDEHGEELKELPVEWTRSQSLGGLKYINATLFNFVKSVYAVSVMVVSNVHSNCNLLELVMNAIIDDQTVLDCWSILDPGCDFSDDLLYIFVKKLCAVMCKGL
jgi:hypothetical protein